MRPWTYLVALTVMSLMVGCNADQSGTPPPQAEVSTQEEGGASSDEPQVTTNQEATKPDTASSNQQVQASEDLPDDSPGLSVGEKAPHFDLKDQNGKNRSLTEMLKSGQVAMVFYRSADW